MDSGDSVVCPGCGLVGGDPDGPTHPYILSSPRCWSLYGELLATGPAGTLAVDTYAVQHPGRPERRAIQSVGIHLVSLCAAFERAWPAEQASQLLQRVVDRELDWQWLDPEPPLGTVTIAAVLGADSWDGRSRMVRRWAEEMWSVYEAHHPLVREWLAAVIGE